MTEASDQGRQTASSNGGAGQESVASTAVQGTAYSLGSSLITWVLGTIRLILLTRLLLPEDVGVFTQAFLFVNLAIQIYGLGLNSAFVNDQKADERALATFFTLRLLTMGMCLGLLAWLAPAISRFYPHMPLLTSILLAMTAAEVLRGLNAVQMTALSKNLAFRRLALADVAASVVMTIVAPLVAWYGGGAWSLVAEQASGYAARAAATWLGPGVWRPRLAWDGKVVRSYLRFGANVWTGNNLTFFLDRFDDFWIGLALGDRSLGLYARAYEFARYPRRVIAGPILEVFFPVFARLQDDRPRLSQAFFRTTSLMLRSGALLSLLFILTAPEFIPLILGQQWAPMQLTFQLMIVYTLLDPLAVTAMNLLIAAGAPQAVVRTRALQVAVFIPAVLALGGRFGIEGVAVAANLMVLTGALAFFHQSRRIVDYSPRALWLWPLAAMAISGGVTVALNPLWAALAPWTTLFAKIALIVLLYGTMLWLAEREQLLAGWRTVWRLLQPRLRTWVR